MQGTGTNMFLSAMTTRKRSPLAGIQHHNNYSSNNSDLPTKSTVSSPGAAGNTRCQQNFRQRSSAHGSRSLYIVKFITLWTVLGMVSVLTMNHLMSNNSKSATITPTGLWMRSVSFSTTSADQAIASRKTATTSVRVPSGPKTAAMIPNKNSKAHHRQNTFFPNTVHLGTTNELTKSYFDALRPLLADRGRPKYNGLDLKHASYVASGRFPREILADDALALAADKKYRLEDMDHSLDDYYLQYDEREYPAESDCIMPAWRDLHFPTCNTFHEHLTLERPPEKVSGSVEIRYLAHGFYRDTFLWNSSSSDRFVLKRLRLSDELSFKFTVLEQIRTEALLMERLSASPRTTNIYGHCAGSVTVEPALEITNDIVPWTEHQHERGRISEKKLNRLQKQHNTAIFSFNNYTAEEKLDIAIQMAEAVAEMHGFSGSIVVNSDVHPDQWLQVPTETGGRRVILNDMNNAVFLQWNPVEQEYCPYYQEYGGDFHSPEEFAGGYVDEQCDIWPVGNMIFCLLTGLWPYYDIPYERRSELQALAIAGQLPYINPAYAKRSLIEYRLVEVMNLCYKREPKDRLSIFEVVEHLRHTKLLHERELERAQQNAMTVF